MFDNWARPDVKKLDLKPGDVLAIKVPPRISPDQVCAMLKHYETLLEDAVRFRVSIFPMFESGNFRDIIQVIPEKEMNAMGWYRKANK